MPFLIIPLVLFYNNNFQNNVSSIEDIINSNIKTVIGGLNNSGAKCVIKAIWSTYGEKAAKSFLENTTILDMPIQSFNDVKNGSYRLAITPSIYAKCSDNKNLFMNYPKDGAIALPSYITANKSVDEETMLKIIHSITSIDFCNSFVRFASLFSCIPGTENDSLIEENSFNFLYPSKQWLITTNNDDFYELYNQYAVNL